MTAKKKKKKNKAKESNRRCGGPKLITRASWPLIRMLAWTKDNDMY